MSFLAVSLVQSPSDSAAASPGEFSVPVELSPTDRESKHPLSPTQGGDMAGARATLLCCVLLAAARGLHLCCGTKLLKGLEGQSLFFPALRPVSEDIVRVTWRSRGTHIAEAKPREKMFTVNYLPDFRDRLLIHPTNLSLEIRLLQLGDRGKYKVVVDTLSDPTNPKTFSYLLLVHGDSPEMATGTGDAGGHSGSTVGPRGASEPHAGDATTQSTGGGQPPGSNGGPGACGVRDHYCAVKGYLVAAVFGPLLILVATIHIMTRDKATKPGDEVSVGPTVGSEPPGITAVQGPYPWQR
ncbi:uncharacterized protein [Ciconia boyciana]|uniref:uncharacterized protein n=1 Tax=Ciconia boyciana TaxID=52775 RepID=UPI003B9F3045